MSRSKAKLSARIDSGLVEVKSKVRSRVRRNTAPTAPAENLLQEKPILTIATCY